jgi:hypothetical protein
MTTSHRHYRRIESPKGNGSLHDGERFFATVTYGLRVLQEVIGTRHWSGSGASKGEVRINGGFSVTSGSLPFDGDQLTLHLDDGRVLPFLVVGSGPDYTIEPMAALAAVTPFGSHSTATQRCSGA